MRVVRRTILGMGQMLQPRRTSTEDAGVVMAIFEHRRSTRRHGLYTLGTFALTIAGMGVFQFYFFPSIWNDDPSFVVIFWVIATIAAVLAVVYATVNIVKGGEFVCRMDESNIECVSPVRGCGQTFKLQIADIARVEKQE